MSQFDSELEANETRAKFDSLRCRFSELLDGSPLAHIGEAGPQTLSSHLSGVSRRSGALAEKLGLGRSGELLGLLHDLGKASEQFQKYLRSFVPGSGEEPQDELRGQIDHSSAGAQCIIANLPNAQTEASLAGLVGRLLALCIASHHSGMIDCLDPEGGDRLAKRLSKSDEHTHYVEAWSRIDVEIHERAESLMQDPKLLAECRSKLASVLGGSASIGDRDVQFGILLRMLFSCLIDADRTDTANHENPHAAPWRQDARYETWDVLLARFETQLAKLSPEGAVNRIRAGVSRECLEAAARPQGIYTLSVPTGGGKTLAALRFALEHARRHHLDRIIFVSPYISIVDQNAAVARAYLEPDDVPYATVVLEHHSDIASERDGNTGRESWRRKLLAENWDAPVVFTTMVQVLESLFGAGTRSVRRLHAMAKAVLVFDEVQTLPVKLVHLFNNALNLLTTHCGSTGLLCTATQPLLDRVDIDRGAAKLASDPELIHNVDDLYRQLHRYNVFDESARTGGWTQDDVAALACEEAARHGSCLVVVNTKRDAREVYRKCIDQLGTDAEVFHLSTAMCPAHRSEVLNALKSALAQTGRIQPIICISTQLIEAGVDIDFAVVVRDLAGLDSIAQAAGRCNRNGLRSQSGRVHIVKLPDLPKGLHDIRMGREVAEEELGIWRRTHPGEPFPLDSPAKMENYYEKYFFRRSSEMTYPFKATSPAGRSTTLLELLGKNGVARSETLRQGIGLSRSILLQSFKTANECFELIEATQGVVVPFGEGGKKIIAEISASSDLPGNRILLRRAQPYTVSVHASQLKQLIERGALYEGSGTGIYFLHPPFYDSAIGLRPEAGPLEELIV
jgi:CRISPR-associated endonuclease/helicase Cas3